MLCVVIGHAPLLSIMDGVVPPEPVFTLYKMVYAFHMPLFVFVSGYLFQMTRIEKPVPYGKMYLEKLVRLGIPALVFIFIATIAKSLFPHEMSRPIVISIRTFVDAILFPGESALNETWFIATLLWYFALQPAWRACSKWWVALILGIVFIITFYVPTPDGDNLFCYKNALHYAVFFLMGTAAKRYNIFERPMWLYTGIGVAVAVVITGIEHFTIGNIQLGYALLGITLSIAGAKTADRHIPWLFLSFRNYTYQIYLMGIFAQIAVKILYRHGYIPTYALGYILCIACGIYLPVAASKIVEKINNKYIKILIGLKS